MFWVVLGFFPSLHINIVNDICNFFSVSAQITKITHFLLISSFSVLTLSLLSSEYATHTFQHGVHDTKILTSSGAPDSPTIAF